MDRCEKLSALLKSLSIRCKHKRNALTNSSFKRFPRELIEQIADSLDVASAALFSISCKTIYFIIGPKYILNLTRHENLLFRRIMEYDIKNLPLNGCCNTYCALQPRDLHHHICFFAPYHRDDFPWTVERDVPWNVIREGSESGGFQKDQITFVKTIGSTLVRQRRVFQGKCGEVIRLRVDICAHLQCYSNSMHIRPRVCPTSRDRIRYIRRKYPESSWGLYWKKVEEETSEIEHCVECRTEFSIRFVHVRDCIPNLHCRMELKITTWKELGRKVDDKIWRGHFPEPQKYVPIPIPRVKATRTRIANAFTPLAVLNLLPFV
ncbi:uncharacterized protein Bfra_009819 [Botrytis fragariae]|uniref:F-box domain-containing protein n=1 Tax=Botrytis fragariae TaxID=1964551 RepID=A0A8H6AMZ5_9HELO|nr:uncharacterized protein Bfra_009819 [Botrytis fragariae]KAF5870432.1 hypothetical protein Bfra_009819 [Botrytis fragariae]